MKNIRIPVFTGQFLFHIHNELVIEKDEVDLEWIDTNWEPQFGHSRDSHPYDAYAERELFRLVKYQTCPFCREKMYEIFPVGIVAKVFVCKNCFYWGGRGNRPMVGGRMARGNLGRMQFVNNPEEAKLELVINHLRSNSARLYDLTPAQAEKILPNVLSDYLDCEVKAFGGTKDKGIDALAIRGVNEKVLIQIKWRENRAGAEGVSVVREVGGTLLARSIPNGLIISTRKKFSKEAKEEAKLISRQQVISIGQLQLTLKDFNDLIDMFEVSSKIRTEKVDLDEIIPYYDGGFELFGTH